MNDIDLFKAGLFLGSKPKVVLCEKCVYWEPISHRMQVGKCKRKAPAPVVRHREAAYWEWPETYNHDGCGEGHEKTTK